MTGMPLPQEGMGKDEILHQLADYRAGDVRWQDGRTFGMVYDAGPEAHATIRFCSSGNRIERFVGWASGPAGAQPHALTPP